MAAPYTPVTVTGYNANPPADDASVVESNKILWSKHKTKIGDPLKTAIESINTNLVSAFTTTVAGGGITTTAISLTLDSTHQGKLIKATAAGITLTTPSATTVGAPFVFSVLNNTTGDITVDGSGAQTIDGTASITISAGAGVMLYTDGTNWFTDGQNFSRTQVPPQGYLTVVSATPVIVSDQTAKTTVYYTPDVGDLLPIPDGTKFLAREFTELTLTLVANHTANSIYDVFAFLDPSDSTTIILGTGPAWGTGTAGAGARGSGAGTTELSRLKGMYVNNVAMTARNSSTTYAVGAKTAVYLGSIWIDAAAGQVSCHRSYGQSRKWSVWNAFNKRSLILRGGDATTTWTYSTAVIRASNNDATNKCSVFCGLAEDIADIIFTQNISQTTTAASLLHGIGVNSTTVAATALGGAVFAIATPTTGAWLHAEHIAAPALGINDYQMIEEGSANTTTWYGTNSYMLMTAEYRG